MNDYGYANQIQSWHSHVLLLYACILPVYIHVIIDNHVSLKRSRVRNGIVYGYIVVVIASVLSLVTAYYCAHEMNEICQVLLMPFHLAGISIGLFMAFGCVQLAIRKFKQP